MTDIVRCIAIDDEPLALEVIKKFCQRMENVCIDTYTDPIKGLDAITSNRPNIVFIDIEMENISGLDIASRLPEQTCFIFTTAYLHYAIDGFDLDAVDYLHKPFSFARFRTAFEKALRRLGQQKLNRTSKGSIIVKQEYSNIRINLSEIVFIEAMEGYCKIFKTNGECVMSRVLLKNISTMLPEQEFIRIHRSFIVSKSKIKSFNKQIVILISEKALPIGRQYANDVYSKLNI